MKYSGSWAKGFAGAFDPVGGINLGLQWKEKKKAQKKIDDAIEQLKINSSTLAAKFDAARADKLISQEEYGDAMAWAIPLGKEIMGKTKELYSNYQNMTSDQLQTEIDNINAILDYSAELDFANIEEMKAFGNKLTQPGAKMQWDLIIKSIKKRKAAPEDIWGQAGKLPQDIRADYLRQKGIDIPQTAEAPPTEIDLMAETKKKLDYAYATGNASHFNQIAKANNVPTTFETYKQGYEKPEVGGTAKEPTPIPFKTLQTVKDSFKNVKTKAEYDEALQSYNASKEAKSSDWTPPTFEKQITSLIKKVESALWSDYVNKSGKLKNKAEAEEYNRNLQHYLSLIEEAKNAGIDVSQFQAFIPYESSGFLGMGNKPVTSESW